MPTISVREYKPQNPLGTLFMLSEWKTAAHHRALQIKITNLRSTDSLQQIIGATANKKLSRVILQPASRRIRMCCSMFFVLVPTQAQFQMKIINDCQKTHCKVN